MQVGPQVLGELDAAAAREWLVTDGLGGYSMGTMAGLETRRYHGLLMVATDPPRGRTLGLVSLDPVIVLGDVHIQLATHEWADGTVAPAGYRYLAAFSLLEGVPRWRYQVGPVILEVELAMQHGRPAVGVIHRLVAAPGPVRLELNALCTWRDAHGERAGGGDPHVEITSDGFVFESAYRVRGPGYESGGQWYRGIAHREERARGLNPTEDVWSAGRFVATLERGDVLTVEAWARNLEDSPPPAMQLVNEARARFRQLAAPAQAADPVERLLAHAADQLVVEGPTVVAGYPWFGDWSRDTMTSYEGLFLETGRFGQGRQLLASAAETVSEGMLANTADAGGTEYNTVDATPWFLHALDRHVTVIGDLDLAAAVFPTVESIIDHHLAGTRFGIRVDDDGLLTQGAEGWALTWMDARVEGVPITPRHGKPVEVNALWVSVLARLARIGAQLGKDAAVFDQLHAVARSSFRRRYPGPRGLYDVVDGPAGDDGTLRPNQLLAVSLPDAPFDDPAVVAACDPLLTPLGLRSLEPADPDFRERHRGGPSQRDAAYHQGTVWPWLIGPYVEGCLRTGRDPTGVLTGLQAHLLEWGLGSVSETADGSAPHAASGCPFQAWSVAELFRARRLVHRR